MTLNDGILLLAHTVGILNLIAFAGSTYEVVAETRGYEVGFGHKAIGLLTVATAAAVLVAAIRTGGLRWYAAVVGTFLVATIALGNVDGESTWWFVDVAFGAFQAAVVAAVLAGLVELRSLRERLYAS